MLILLPPSEGKSSPRRGKRLDLADLSYPTLTETRRRLLDALVELCRGDPERARGTLGLTEGQRDEVVRNAGLPEAATAPAGRIYTGVLYDSLALAAMSAAAKRRAASRVAVVSSLFGLVRLGDRIPSYRLKGTVTLPGVGSVSSAWREPLGAVLSGEAARGLAVDLRSSTYAAFGRPSGSSALHVATVRVVQELDGVRSVVSHVNKATKGRLVADLLEDGANPGSTAGLERALTRLGWNVERSAAGVGLDVVLTARR